MGTLTDNLIQATGWSILHSLWQGALIYMLLLPFQIKMSGFNARVRYAAAYIATCLMFVSFLATFFSVFQWPGATIASGLTQHTGASRLSVSTSLTTYIENVFPWLVLFYTAGLLLQCLLIIKGYQKVQKLKRAAYTEATGELNVVFDKLVSLLGIKKHVNFRLSEHVSVPLVVGYLKPVILFPMALATNMDVKQIEAILIHELSHIRRNDYLFNLIRTVIETVMFFNPFIWLAGRLINIEREHACDDIVVSATNTPLTYAHALLQLELITAENNPRLALAATGNNQHLYQRIKRITDMKTTYVNSKQKLLTLSLTLATIISLAWINPAKEKKESDKMLKGITVSSAIREVNLQDTLRKKVKTKAGKKVNTSRDPKPGAVPQPDKNMIAPPLPPADYKTAPLGPAAPRRAKTAIPVAPEPPAAPEAPEPLVITIPAPDVSELTNFVMNIKLDSIRFNSEKERVKLEKMAQSIAAKYNSREHKEKIRKIQLKAVQQAKHAMTLMNDAKFRKGVHEFAFTTDPINIVVESDDTRKVKQSPEYQELKKKFEKDVADLVEKNTRAHQN